MHPFSYIHYLGMANQKILVVNPNSSQSVTDNLKNLIEPQYGFQVDFYTGPPSAPAEIDGPESAHQSAKACLPELEPLLKDYDAMLIGCYSNHPLIADLKKADMSKNILGIFQASLLYSLTHTPSVKFAILTSTKSWEKVLDESMLDFFYGPDSNVKQLPTFAVPTKAANVSVLELGNPEKFEKLKRKVQELVDQGVRVILLGCAGLSGLDQKFAHIFPDVKFVDSVKVGVYLLYGLVGFDSI